MPDASTPAIFRVRELEIRYRSPRFEIPIGESLSDPASAARVGAQLLRDAATEIVLLLHLNVRRRAIGVHRIVGSTESVAVAIPEICRAVLLSNARALICVHNHLSGDPTPSTDDHAFALRLRDAVRVLGMELLDAIIVVDPADGPQYYSFQQEGLL